MCELNGSQTVTTTQLPKATVSDHSRTLSELVTLLYCWYCHYTFTAAINDLCDVLEAVSDLNDWMSLGLKLGLCYPTLERIGEEQRGNISQCKLKMMVVWLQQQDMVSQRGVPSWSVLEAAQRKCMS